MFFVETCMLDILQKIAATGPNFRNEKSNQKYQFELILNLQDSSTLQQINN